mmetsp:Transcript_355/g.922  ORF Transcript_355/g.922 Transcript_355/m.922 type:complete len:155 (+) Transcript_355:2648-3112(+)
MDSKYCTNYSATLLILGPTISFALSYRYEVVFASVAKGLSASWTCAVMAWSRALTLPRGAEGAAMAITMQSTPTQVDTATNPSSNSSNKHCRWLFLLDGDDDDDCTDTPDDDDAVAAEAPPVEAPDACCAAAFGALTGVIGTGSKFAYSSPNRL